MLLPKSSCLCYHVLSMMLIGFGCTIFDLFLGTDMKTGKGVVICMYLKYSQDYNDSPDYNDSKYI